MTRVSDDELTRAWAIPPGVFGKLRAVQNNFVGVVFLAATFFFFTIGGFDSVALRTQLAVPENDFLDPGDFNQLFTTHGTAMMFLFAVPMLEALAIYALPLMIGARDMPFPRMSAFTIWTFMMGGLLFYASTLPDIVNFVLPGSPLPDLVPNAGWFAYPPLVDRQHSPGLNIDFYLLGLGFAEFAGIAAAIEIIVSILKTRAPGMSLDRMPLFAWSLLVMAFAILFSFPSVIVATTFLELQRKFGLPFFDPALGGDPLLWQHLFWIFGHPEVYIMLIPATGIVSMVVPAFARRPIAGYVFVATAIAATGFLSFGLWVHHMFTVGLPLIALGLFGAASMMITFPSGVQVFAWLATMVNAPRVTFPTPMLYVIAFIVTFVLGGITGVMVGSVPFDWQTHDTYFVVAHFHYVLVGGVVFPILAGFYYWWPKISGKLLDERLGKWAFWIIFIGFNLTFLPQHSAGLLGMPRRVYTYSAELGLGPYNLLSTIGAYVTAVGFLVVAFSTVRSLFREENAPPNPWGAPGLEWATPSPPPPYNFRDIPLVRSREPLRDGEAEWWRPERTRPPDRDAQVWRETLVTTTFDARPQAVTVLAGDSHVPLLLAVTFTIVSAALLFEIYWLALATSVLSVPPVIRWLWPSSADRKLSGAGATLGYPDLPAQTTGTAATGWWAMVLSLAAIGAALVLTVFSYFYLVYAGPNEVPLRTPALTMALLATAAAVAAVAPAYLALRGIRRGDQRMLRLGLATSFALGALAAALSTIDLLGLGLAPTANAYEAMFATLAGYQICLTLIALAASLFVQAQAWLGFFSARRHLAVENLLLLWAFTAISAVVTVATLYLSPYVL